MRKLALATALVALSSAAAVLAFEGVLRAIGYSAPVWYEADERFGWRLRAGARGLFTQEGRAHVEISAQGLRDRDRPVEKPAGVYRIAVLGDSYSEAMQVPLEAAYWAQLPQRLTRCGFQRGKRIQVINFGVAGYGTAQELILLESRALGYRPDLVLLQFTNGNDVQNNSFALEEERNRPFFLLGRDGELVLDESFAAGEAHRRRASSAHRRLIALTDHLRVLQLVRAARNALRFGGAEGAPNAYGVELAALAEPRDPLWAEAWRVTEALLVEARERAAGAGARFLLVSVPHSVQVHPDRALRAKLQAELGAPDLFYPERRLGALAKKARIDFLPLAPHFLRVSESGDGYLYGFDKARPGFGHWNESGHRAAAEVIARHLCRTR